MQHRSSNARRGFTLVELLVVIGIIVLLVAVGLPMVLRAYKSGNKMRTQADLNSIATALNAYKQDFGDYPRVIDGVGPTGLTIPSINTGAAVLGKALIGPYGDGVNNGVRDNQDPPQTPPTNIRSGQCVGDGPRPGFVALVNDPGSPVAGDKWAVFDANDGADGPGFRVRRGPGPDGVMHTGDDVFQGRVWGPYLQAEKFNVNGVMLHDGERNPILYFPAAVRRPNIRQTGTQNYVNRSEHSLYDARDNIAYFKRTGDGNDDNALRSIRAMLGDMNDNGIIDADEAPATEADFILWTAGPDGQYGPVRTGPGTWTPTRRDIDKCDDITSFTP